MTRVAYLSQRSRDHELRGRGVRLLSAGAVTAVTVLFASVVLGVPGPSPALGRVPGPSNERGIAAGTAAGTEQGTEPVQSCGTISVFGLSGGEGLDQTMSGVLSGCIRVGALPPGHYTVFVDQVIGGAFRPPPPPAFPKVTISLSPPSGAPGTVVTVHGTLASTPPAKPAENDFIDLCWAGCVYGVQYSGTPIHWSSPTTFTTRLTVPGGPWIEQHPDRVLAPRDGLYRIEVACLDGAEGCAYSAEATADYRITGATGFAGGCATALRCATLYLQPGRGLPGTALSLKGELPIESVIGSNQPFVFEAEVRPGYSAAAPEVSFLPIGKARAGGAENVELGNAELTVVAPPSFSSLGVLHPIGEIADGLSPIGENPADPGRVGFCDGSTITVSGPQGVTDLPTGDVASVLDHLGLDLPASEPPQCITLALPPTSTSRAVFASFSVNPHEQAPPFVDAALYTENAGLSWQLVPVPKGAGLYDFGGFRYAGNAVEALFFPRAGDLIRSGGTTSLAASTAVRAPLVEETTDGGATWMSASFGCPTDGPCITFGPYALGNCAMNGTAQLVLRSASKGRSWQTPSWPVAVAACAPAQLVALSTSNDLLVDSSSDYPLRETTNAGKSWFDVALPLLPGETPGMAPDYGPTGLIALPDGGVLAIGQGPNAEQWDLLTPGARSWCTVSSVPARLRADSAYATFEVVGENLDWTAPVGLGSAANAGASLFDVPASSLSC